MPHHITKPPVRIASKKHVTASSKSFLILRKCDLSWNQIELSIFLMYEKLAELDRIDPKL